jgi:hypothetical protein
MTIKIEDIRVGDKVALKVGVVTAVRGKDSLCPITVDIEGDGNAVALSSIETHTPAPREFKPGDEVRHVDTSFVYVFLARFGGKAVVGRLSSDGSPCVTWTDESDLRHADPAPAPQEAPGKEREKIEYWVNAYPYGEWSRAHKSRSEADQAATTRRIACRHVVGYEGDGL